MTGRHRFTHTWVLPALVQPGTVGFTRFRTQAAAEFAAQAAALGLRLVGDVRWLLRMRELVGRADAELIDKKDAA